MRHDNGRWVGRTMARRFRAELGTYFWFEVHQFAAEHDIQIVTHNRHDVPVAFHVGRVVFLREILLARLMAKRAWHEISHIVGLPLNYRYWEQRPMGSVTIAKCEQRVSDFAQYFPVWDSEYRSFFSAGIVSARSEGCARECVGY